MSKHKNTDDVSISMPFEAYVAIEKQKAKEGKADEPITEDEFRQYLLSGKWKK
ncbi:hypothetical protein [Pseudoscardovia suis]|uniref:hypothetical protein n=1 Tax=Pseudoscardovia suis TaxID=987063 RepID=UPI003F9CE0A1